MSWRHAFCMRAKKVRREIELSVRGERRALIGVSRRSIAGSPIARGLSFILQAPAVMRRSSVETEHRTGVELLPGCGFGRLLETMAAALEIGGYAALLRR